MPNRLARKHDEDTDPVPPSRPGLQRQAVPSPADEAGKQLACLMADYAADIRAWLDLNLPHRRPGGLRGAGRSTPRA